MEDLYAIVSLQFCRTMLARLAWYILWKCGPFFCHTCELC